MKTSILTAVFCLIVMYTAYSQEQRTFNQNASRSNHTRLLNADAWSFGFNAGTSFATKSDQSSLFRGNSLASKLFAHYYFDKIGLGISTGIIPGSISDNAMNRFIAERKFPADQLLITRSKPFNSYLLAGPSIRFGNRVSVIADIKGGIFFNNPGALSINQQGVTRALYRFEAGDKNLFPGFSGGISIAYPVSSSTQFFINTDYLQSRSSVRLLDPGAGIDVVTQLNRATKLLTAGVGIIKTFGGNDGFIAKKHIGNVKYEDISMRQGKTGMTRREASVINDNPALSTQQSCGPVTQRIINPDGTTEEMVFSCPADAASYTQKTKTTIAKQTQGATFGEKVNAGLHAAGSALSQGASRNIIAGRLTWLTEVAGGIVTNKSVSSVSALAGSGGGGAAQASYARQTQSASFGTMVRLQARDAGSGMATGKRSKESSSGIATGRRQYQPVYLDNNETECNGCLANVKSNPLYSDKGNHGQNPMHTGKQAAGSGNENGVSGIDVALIDVTSGAMVAMTQTEDDGNFFFANVPEGIYTVRLMGTIATKKGYDVNTTGATDLLGTVSMAPSPIQLYINTGEDTDAPVQKAGISTSRSNIRSKALAIGQSDTTGGRKMIPVTVPDITGAQKNVVAPFFPGGGVVSAIMSRIGPIKGVIVKGGTNGNMRTIETDENGEFEFSNLAAGNNVITLEQNLFIDDETTVIVGSRAQDHNSSRSNKTASGMAIDPNGNNGTNTTKVQDHNSSRSNKSASGIAVDPDGNDGTNTTKAQDHNSSRSNKTASGMTVDPTTGDKTTKDKMPVKWAAPESLKSISVEVDLDGDGVYETDVTAKISDEIKINEQGEVVTAPQQRTGVSTSRSNIRTRSSLQSIGNNLHVGYGSAEINKKIVPVKIVYKEKATSGLKDTLKTQV
jgi:hypothetical protein